MMHIVKSYDGKPVTEVHIVGGVHPKMNMDFFLELLRTIKAHRPELHIKAFTPVELDYMFRKAKVSVEEGMRLAHEAGLDSLPGVEQKFSIPIFVNKSAKIKWMQMDGWLFIKLLTN